MKPELKVVVSNAPPEPTPPPSAPEQVEMPFAVVNGEPVTQLPRDLYIPPQALEVFLEAFEGPLDLLLYLIRRQNLDILDIPLAEITKQYMQYIELMQDLQLELAGEYMVMAATLAEIKSRMLLPRPPSSGDGTEEDPRAELVRRLQEYERFKRAAEGIDTLRRLERDNWVASAELKDRKVVRLLPQVTLQEMLVAFKEVVLLPVGGAAQEPVDQPHGRVRAREMPLEVRRQGVVINVAGDSTRVGHHGVSIRARPIASAPSLRERPPT